MKILASVFTHESITTIRSITEMLIGLHQRGVAIEIITNPNTDYNQKFKSAGITVHEFFPTKKIDFSAIGKLRDILKRGEFDIFQSFHNKWMATGNFACLGLSVLNIGYKGIGFKWHDPTYMLTMNTPLMDYLICLSNTVEQNIKPQLFFQKPKTVQIYKGQDVAWFDADQRKEDLSKYGVPKDAFVVINISIVRKVKGVEYLLDAWNHIPKNLPIHLIQIGDGTDSDAFQQRIAMNQNKDKIHLLGRKEEVVPYLRAADMYVLPTIGLEGLSRSLQEAMAVELPVLVSRSGGPEELVVNGESGEHIPRKDSKAIANGIIDYYHHPEKRKSYAKAGRKRLETTFSIDRYVDEMIQFYQSILPN